MRMVKLKKEKALLISSKNTIKIDGKEIKAGRILNNYFGKGKVITTVSGSKSKVKKEIKEYEGKNYSFRYFIIEGKKPLHIIRVIDLNA